MEGWVKLYRKIEESSFYNDSRTVHLWVHLLIKANKFAKKIIWNGAEVTINPGQFITGRKKLFSQTGIEESKIQRDLKLFEKCEMIKQQTNSRNRLITILNWESHQASEQQTNNKRTTNEQQMNTNKKERKKEGKNKNTYSNEFESCWKIYPQRNGTKQGKKPASILFEKLDIDNKRKCYTGIKNYVPFCKNSDQPAMDFERFIRNDFYNDYQNKINGDVTSSYDAEADAKRLFKEES